MRHAEVQRQGSEGKLVGRDHGCQGYSRCSLPISKLRTAFEGITVIPYSSCLLQGRGKTGMSPEQLSKLEAAVESLEADRGVSVCLASSCRSFVTSSFALALHPLTATVEQWHGHQSPGSTVNDSYHLQDPTDSPLLEGRWRLLFTTRPGSASPIQKTFVGLDAFTVYQEVLLFSAEKARVNNIVDFGAKVGTLKVGLLFHIQMSRFSFVAAVQTDMLRLVGIASK